MEEHLSIKHYIMVSVAKKRTGLSYAGGDAAKTVAELKAFKTSWTRGTLYQTSMGDGTQANNPWLQELPDPISRMWDNYLTISPKDARNLALKKWIKC